MSLTGIAGLIWGVWWFFTDPLAWLLLIFAVTLLCGFSGALMALGTGVVAWLILSPGLKTLADQTGFLIPAWFYEGQKLTGIALLLAGGILCRWRALYSTRAVPVSATFPSLAGLAFVLSHAPLSMVFVSLLAYSGEPYATLAGLGVYLLSLIVMGIIASGLTILVRKALPPMVAFGIANLALFGVAFSSAFLAP